MRKWFTVVVLLALAVLFGGCGVQQETMVERNRVIGERDASSNFLEAKQIAEIEDWKDQPGKIVTLYLFNPSGGLLVPPIQCIGVPTSSGESLEPNSGSPAYSATAMFRVPVDGVDIYTNELAGKDGTFGEPAPFRQCMSVDGQYYDFPALGLPYLVSSASFVFPDSTVKRDIETELKIKQAELIIEKGGCVNYETLEEVECQK